MTLEQLRITAAELDEQIVRNPTPELLDDLDTVVDLMESALTSDGLTPEIGDILWHRNTPCRLLGVFRHEGRWWADVSLGHSILGYPLDGLRLRP